MNANGLFLLPTSPSSSCTASDKKRQTQADIFTAAQVALKRSVLIGPNSALSFDEPLYIVRGKAQYLYDAEDNQYLDCCNNVAHVGHCHPKVRHGNMQLHHTDVVWPATASSFHKTLQRRLAKFPSVYK